MLLGNNTVITVKKKSAWKLVIAWVQMPKATLNLHSFILIWFSWTVNYTLTQFNTCWNKAIQLCNFAFLEHTMRQTPEPGDRVDKWITKGTSIIKECYRHFFQIIFIQLSSESTMNQSLCTDVKKNQTDGIQYRATERDASD